MNLRLVGCSHHSSSVEVRERLAFTPDQAVDALRRLQDRFPNIEAVLLSTCNRVELYLAPVRDLTFLLTTISSTFWRTTTSSMPTA